jgi:hypothetical protein
LDFGAGLGYVTAALPQEKVYYYDPSATSRKFLTGKGFKVFETVDSIKAGFFDILVSSHSLEHSARPFDDLLQFKKYLKENGMLMLILPMEQKPGKMVFEQDDNKHFYCWNFQTITNLLIEAGFNVVHQSVIYGPMGLQKTKKIKLAHKLGSIFKNYPSLYILAKNEIAKLD